MLPSAEHAGLPKGAGLGRYRVSMDIGGTFTDVVAYDEESGTYTAGKASTTPAELTEGVFAGLEQVIESPTSISFTVHGTTVGLNAFLQRRGEKVLLLATEGAGDVYHIARGNRARLYDLHYRKPRPLVPLSDIVEIAGRLDWRGEERTPLDEDAVRAAAARVRDEGFGAVAVALLFSFLNPAHELRVEEILLEELDGVAVSLSHRVAREWREYARTSSAVIEAYTAPAVRRYLGRLQTEMESQGLAVPLHVMQSSGGVVTAESARERPLQTLLSGPVGGTMGLVALARALGRPNLIGVDMGGTSFDVSLVIGGKPDVSTETSLEGFPLLMPIANIHTIGAGGGSLAYAEAGGLRVGPESAGADPGPACYGRGGERPTVTDANLVLGRIDPGTFAGGRMTLDPGAARKAVEQLGAELGLDADALAEGIVSVINAKMAQAIRTLTVEQGIEPRDFALVAFGGAGPMHAAFLAQELGIAEVIVPGFAGAFSAWGMLETELRRDFTRPFFRRAADADLEELAALCGQIAAEGRDALEAEGVAASTCRVEHSLDMRYEAQEYTLAIPIDSADAPQEPGFLDEMTRRFNEAHELRYGHSNPGAPVELVAVRAAALGDLGHAEPEDYPARNGRLPERTRDVLFDGAAHPTRVLRREEDLGAGASFDGPLIVEETTATTVVPPGSTLTVDRFGSLVISIGAEAA
jgi:N-methylhydantoinase A